MKMLGLSEARGRHVRPRRIRPLVLAAALCLVLAGVGGTYAWYCQESGLKNVFDRGRLGLAVDEAFDPAAGEKRDVAVEVPANASNTSAYVRAKVDVYWQDAEGTRLWDAPVEKRDAADAAGAEYDYEMAWADYSSDGADARWEVGADGLYYWTTPVDPGAATGPLVDVCREQRRYDDGRSLVVDVTAQAIQADPASAFDESWGPRSGFSVGPDGIVAASQAQGGGCL